MVLIGCRPYSKESLRVILLTARISMKLFTSVIVTIALSVSMCTHAAPMDLSPNVPLSSSSSDQTPVPDTSDALTGKTAGAATSASLGNCASANASTEIADAARQMRILFGMRKQGLITPAEFEEKTELILGCAGSSGTISSSDPAGSKWYPGHSWHPGMDGSPRVPPGNAQPSMPSNRNCVNERGPRGGHYHRINGGPRNSGDC